ncbi:MAG TPA: DUF1365 domain-containing protein [Ramlibacter sp.]|nr:DUF1365 domain-containing protein [Ramlibacter sp.]
MNGPLIGFGEVRHTRLRPVRHAFAYPTCFLLLPMRSLRRDGSGALARNRTALLSFHDRDHGDGSEDALAWLDALLQRHGIAGADGEVWLHCYPRVLGHAFKPVSFWYCHRADGALRAIVVEVNNTFGERHCYLLDAPAWGRELLAVKAFHVSPFCRVEGRYRFRFVFSPSRARTVARIDFDDDEGALLRTSVSGDLQTATASALRRALWRHPALTLGIVARIHWQALRLWLRQVPFHRKPAAPAQSTTAQLS